MAWSRARRIRTIADRVLAVLTPEGRRAYEKGSRVQGEAERQLFDALSGDDSVRLADILGKLDRARGWL